MPSRQPLARARAKARDLDRVPDWTVESGQAVNPVDLDAVLQTCHPRSEFNARRMVRDGGVSRRGEVFEVRTWHKPRSPVMVLPQDGAYLCHACRRTQDDPCGHVLAVLIWLDEARRPKSPDWRRGAHDRNWKAINDYRRTARYLFPRFLAGLVNTVPEPHRPAWKRGRKPIPLRNALFATLMRTALDEDLGDTFSTLSESRYQRYNSRQPSMNVPSRILNEKSSKYILDELLMTAAATLGDTETDFAIDGSAFSCNSFSPVMEAKHRVRKRREREFYLSIQVTGIRSNVVVAAFLKRGRGSETEHMLDLFHQAQRVFPRLKKWTADAAYHSRKNYSIEDEHGVDAWIVAPETRKGRAEGSPAFSRKTKLFLANREKFFRLYAGHQNVESTNHMVAQRLGWVLRSRNHSARINEGLCKYIVHSLHVLIQEYHRSGRIPDFHEAAIRIDAFARLPSRPTAGQTTLPLSH